MPTRSIRIEATKNHAIRARLYVPPTTAYSRPTKAAILAHPYIHHAGSYNNHVIVSLAALLEELGYVVLTFNFRRRKISYNGHVEVDDMRSCIDWLLHAHEGINDLIIGGYSYGALVASACEPHAIHDRHVSLSWLFVSLPLHSYKYSLWMFPKPRRVYRDNPVLGIWGSEDDFAPLKRFTKKQNKPNWTVRTILGSAHFIEEEQHKTDMMKHIVNWIDEQA